MSFERVFMYGCLQFCGHVEEYFIANTRDLLVFIVQPRIGEHSNLLRRYQSGVLIEERTVRSSQNLFLYYFLWYMNHVRELFRFCPKDQKTLVFGGHPVCFLGMGVFKLARPLSFAYWIGDYFPSRHPLIRLFEWLKRRIQRRVDFAYYLSDSINRIMNGAVVDTPCRRTVMWGLKPFPEAPVPPPEPFTLLFVGMIRPGQGLETLFDFMETHGGYRLSLIGVGHADYVAELQERLRRTGLAERVFFPNRFYPHNESELLEVARGCHVGIALYDTGAENFTHYADPGKVKAYAEMRLPVLMTRISDIVPFVERFQSGEVIDNVDQIGDALERIHADHARYRDGVAAFNAHFDYERYYDDAFRVFEKCWTRPGNKTADS